MGLNKKIILYLKYLLLALVVNQSSVTYAKPAKRAVKVIVEKVSQDEFYEVIEALGNLKANETTNLTSVVMEMVTEIHFTDGQKVKKGQVLVEMSAVEENTQLVYANAELKEAKQQYARASALTQKGAAAKSLLDERKRQLDTAKAKVAEALSKVEDRRLVAPYNGELGLRQISVGTLIKPGDKIITINDNSKMKLDFSVPSIYLSALETGLSVIATSRTYKDIVFKGKVVSIDNNINLVTRSILARAVVQNPDGTLKPGMLMNIKLLHNQRIGLALPEEALIQNGKNYHVYVFNDKTKTVSKTKVTIGARKPGEVEIISGLQAGEQVVTHGGLKLSDGSQVKILSNQSSDIKKAQSK